MTRMQELYNSSIKADLVKKFGYKNEMMIPKLDKIVVNMGVGKGAEDKKIIAGAVADMTAITGQKPVVTHARKSIAGFKLREGSPVGCKVTLRGKKMYEFLDRLVTVALPRVRVFEGVPTKSFDKQGNYSLGIKEQIVFVEIDYDQIESIRGMDIIICTTAKNAEESRALLDGFGMPFHGKNS